MLQKSSLVAIAVAFSASTTRDAKGLKMLALPLPLTSARINQSPMGGEPGPGQQTMPLLRAQRGMPGSSRDPQFYDEHFAYARELQAADAAQQALRDQSAADADFARKLQQAEDAAGQPQQALIDSDAELARQLEADLAAEAGTRDGDAELARDLQAQEWAKAIAKRPGIFREFMDRFPNCSAPDAMGILTRANWIPEDAYAMKERLDAAAELQHQRGLDELSSREDSWDAGVALLAQVPASRTPRQPLSRAWSTLGSRSWRSRAPARADRSRSAGRRGLLQRGGRRTIESAPALVEVM